MPRTAATASIEPTERSIPAVRMTKVIPEASTRLIATWRTMFMLLALEMKFDVPSAL